MDMSGRGFLIGMLHNFTHDIKGRFNPILKGKWKGRWKKQLPGPYIVGRFPGHRESGLINTAINKSINP